MTRKAFSLIELTVVLLIVGIAASAVALRVAAPMKAANMDDACRRARQFDELTRSYCRGQGRPVVMEFTADGKRIRRLNTAGESVGGECELGDDLTITAVLLAGTESYPAGNVRVACSSLGFAPTYAMLIEGPGRQRRWLIFAGLTGEVTETTDDAQVRGILEALARSEIRNPNL